jgi:hypothetical protein
VHAPNDGIRIQISLEIAGIVDGGFGSKSTFLFVILLDSRGLVIGVQRRRRR